MTASIDAGPIQRRNMRVDEVSAGGSVPGMEIKEGGLGTRSQSLALATLCAVVFLTFLDNTVVSVGLANVQSSLHAGITSLQWVVPGLHVALEISGGLLVCGAIVSVTMIHRSRGER
jgi:hypothetical protein